MRELLVLADKPVSHYATCEVETPLFLPGGEIQSGSVYGDRLE